MCAGSLGQHLQAEHVGYQVVNGRLAAAVHAQVGQAADQGGEGEGGEGGHGFCVISKS